MACLDVIMMSDPRVEWQTDGMMERNDGIQGTF